MRLDIWVTSGLPFRRVPWTSALGLKLISRTAGGPSTPAITNLESDGVLMAAGRDATYVPLTTSFGSMPLAQFTVVTQEVPQEHPNANASGASSDNAFAARA